MTVPETIDRPAWHCQECGHKFRSAKDAEHAACGPDGCPRCGSSEIALGKPEEQPCP